MKEFIEKLITRLEELNQSQIEKYTECLCEGNLACIYDKTDIEETKVKATYEIIQIVNELAGEYKGGWIPCSERLPEPNKYCLVTYSVNGRLHVDAWIFNGVDFNEVGETKVTAWQPLPPAWKGESNGQN